MGVAWFYACHLSENRQRKPAAQPTSHYILNRFHSPHRLAFLLMLLLTLLYSPNSDASLGFRRIVTPWRSPALPSVDLNYDIISCEESRCDCEMYSSLRSGNLGLEMSLHRSVPNPSQKAADSAQIQESTQFGARLRNHNAAGSDDDGEPGFSGEDSRRMASSPWQRMKWTDNMVRLLIMLVFYVGDEACGEGSDRKKGSCNGGGGNGVPPQRKGKWKSVSDAMMERGFNVSPQQCEDKFNDLNKRYKRVNDILGKGTACRVVEDQTLLDEMDHLSPRAKEEVRKMINSKHLFFREMCAYHNSCSHGSVTAIRDSNSGEIPNLSKIENDDDDDDDDDSDDEEDDEDVIRKRARTEDILVQQMECEFGNNGRQGWMREKLRELEEESVGIKARGLELEKQRFKWLKFSTNKEMEMEKERLMNERIMLENERMALFIQQQMLALGKKGGPSFPFLEDPAMEEE